MTSQDFVYWIKGYLAAQQDSQMKLDIEKALKQVNEGQVSGTVSLSNYPNGITNFTYNTKQQLND